MAEFPGSYLRKYLNPGADNYLRRNWLIAVTKNLATTARTKGNILRDIYYLLRLFQTQQIALMTAPTINTGQPAHQSADKRNADKLCQ